MIKPTIGRVVWFWEDTTKQSQPWPGIICYVHSDIMINLTVFDANGNSIPKTSVHLYNGDENIERPVHYFAEWMPYQKGQAAKTEELEKKLS